MAQTSAYQTADGTTSIFLHNANANLVFNVTDAKFDIGYLHEPANDKAGSHVSYGLNLTGKPATSLSSQIFQTGAHPAALGGAISLGSHGIFSKPVLDQVDTDKLRDDWALVQFSYSRSTFDTVADATSAPQKQRFDSYKFLMAYNSLVNAPGTMFLVGMAAGIQRKNNVDNLKPATINTPLAQSGSGPAAVEVVKQSSGYFGSYKEAIGAPIYTDVAFIPKRLSWVTIDLFTRSDAAHSDRFFEPGAGLFIAPPDNPTKVLGGLSLGWKNGVPTWAFVAGWAFSTDCSRVSRFLFRYFLTAFSRVGYGPITGRALARRSSVRIPFPTVCSREF
jgi:hypothetical protein